MGVGSTPTRSYNIMLVEWVITLFQQLVLSLEGADVDWFLDFWHRLDICCDSRNKKFGFFAPVGFATSNCTPKSRNSTRGHRIVGDKLCFRRTNRYDRWLLVIHGVKKIGESFVCSRSWNCPSSATFWGSVKRKVSHSSVLGRKTVRRPRSFGGFDVFSNPTVIQEAAA